MTALSGMPRCMSLDGVIGGNATPVTVIRRAPGQYEKGRYTKGEESTFAPLVSVQPLTGRQMLLLPENVRNRNSILIFSTAELRVAEPSSNTEADTVLYKGRRYEVTSVKDWSSHGGYWEVIAVQEGLG